MKKLLLVAVMTLGLLVGVVPAANADVNDFVINNFDAQYTLTKDDPQGSLHIVEDIKLTFHDYNHGILRALPKSYNHHPLHIVINSVKSPSGAASQYTTYSSNGNKVLKIGDPNNTITGKQEYIIDYTVDNVITFKDGKQQLIWNVNGTEWNQKFEHVSATLVDKTNSNSMTETFCFTGAFSSRQQDCIVTKGEQTLVENTVPLTANQNMTFLTQYPNGTFTAFTAKDTIDEIAPKIASLVLPIILIGGYSFRLWLRRGRDIKGRGVIIPEYEAPDGMSPMVAGTVIDFNTSTKDITATIIDLAIRRYIKIVESKKVRALAKDGLEYNLELLNIDFSSLDPQEKTLLDSIFPDKTTGKSVDVSSMATKLYSTSVALGKAVRNKLKDEGYYRGSLGAGPIIMVVFTWIMGVLALLIGIAAENYWLIAGLVISAAISVICLCLMSARTAKGTEAKEKMMGLKMYLEVAEKNRINKLQSPNAAYSDNHEPVKTVQLFEKLLPYAIVLGVEQGWAKQFESMYTSPPDWYAGSNWNAFNSAILVSNINSGIGSAVNTAFAAPSSSGGSGGFSGGGGGGGGGGGW